MAGLEYVVMVLLNEGVEGEVWVDGSFLTVKMEPTDVDVVLRMSAGFYDNASASQKKTVQWLLTGLKSLYYCDSYFFMEWPKGHASYWFGQYMHNYWMRQFGFSRVDTMKGIAVVSLNGGMS